MVLLGQTPLFEDNAEFGLGMAMAVKQMREGLKVKLEELKAVKGCEVMSETIDAYINTMNDGEANKVATTNLVALLEKFEGS